MNGDQLTLVGVLIVSLLGTTGLTGLLSGGIEIGAGNRLRKRAERALDLRDRFKPRSAEWDALSYAARLSSIRLAALTAVGLKRRLKSLIGSFIGAGITYVVLGLAILAGGDLEERTSVVGFGQGTRLQLGLSFAAATIILSIAFAVLLQGGLRRSRDAFVRAVLGGEPVEAVAARLVN